MKIVIPGGTGQVGRIIYAHRFDAPNDEFGGAIGRNEPNAPDAWRFSIEVAQRVGISS